jgi:hypothetical protein
MTRVVAPIDEADRQLLLLALALCALLRPGFDDALERVAAHFEPADDSVRLYRDFKRLNADRV